MKQTQDGTFSPHDFIQDNTILTSLEDYAQRVRKDVEDHRNKVVRESERMSKEADEDRNQAKLKLEQASAEAETIVSQANEEAEGIRQQAREEGFEEGRKKGETLGRKKSEAELDRLSRIVGELEGMRKTLFRRHEREIAEVCLLLSKMIVGNELKTNRDFPVLAIGRLLHRFEGMDKIKIRLHSIDYDYLASFRERFEGMLDEDQKIVLVLDDSASPGAPIMESDFTAIDLDVAKQFEVAESVFRRCGRERASLYLEEDKKEKRGGDQVPVSSPDGPSPTGELK